MPRGMLFCLLMRTNLRLARRNEKGKRKGEDMKKIILAVGCFCGVEAYFKQQPFISDSTVGYVNSRVEEPDYKLVCTGTTGAAEAVELHYSDGLDEVLKTLFHIIDPTLMNRQGNDYGSQYRTGVYYESNEDREAIERFIDSIRANYDRPIVTEVLPLDNFWPAEEYHQDYLDKNPGGYCHIDLNA